MKLLPTILQCWVGYCLFLVVWAKVVKKVQVRKPKPPSGPPVTIVDDEYWAHFIKQGETFGLEGSWGQPQGSNFPSP